MFLAVGVQRATPQRVVTFESKHSLGNVGLGDDDGSRSLELFDKLDNKSLNELGI